MELGRSGCHVSALGIGTLQVGLCPLQHLIKLQRSIPHVLTNKLTALQWGDPGTGFGKAYREVICPYR